MEFYLYDRLAKEVEIIMNVYVIAILKLIVILIVIPLVGDFMVTKLLNLDVEWIYNLLLALSCVYAMDAIPHTFSKPYTWEKFTDVWTKIQLFIIYVIWATCSLLPASQGSKESWLNILFFLLGGLITLPVWIMLARKEQKQKVLD